MPLTRSWLSDTKPPGNVSCKIEGIDMLESGLSVADPGYDRREDKSVMGVWGGGLKYPSMGFVTASLPKTFKMEECAHPEVLIILPIRVYRLSI